MSRELRKGYTTGSCCAAAAGAGLLKLLAGKNTKTYRITGPTGAHILVPIKEEKILNEREVISVVVKDGGDDPDITTGAEVVVRIKLVKDFSEIFGNNTLHQNLKVNSATGYFLNERVYLKAGEGIGLVTKPGLACKEGKAAINPVPRKMILKEVLTQVERCCYEGKVLVEIAIPKGMELAERTFNPKLGITGGISVLGTTGVVEPMSSEAILDTVKVELSVAKAMEKSDTVIITPGNYGMDFLKNNDFIEDFPEENIIRASNFIGESMVLAAETGFEHLIVSGHLGKMIKVAGGMLNTHSKYGDNRIETAVSIIEELAAESKQKKDADNVKCSWLERKDQLIELVRQAVMVDEILRLLLDIGGEVLLKEFCQKTGEKVRKVLTDNLLKVHVKYDKIRTDVIIFTNKYGLLFCDEI